MEKAIYLLCVCFTILSCSNSKSNLETEETKSDSTSISTLPVTSQPGKLIAFFENSVTSYYINKGYPRGFEYEMLSLFCKDNDLELEIKMIHSMDLLLDSLIDGRADIVAANLSVTGERKELVSFSNPILRTKQVLIQRLPKNYKKLSKSKRDKLMVMDALDLDKMTVHVHENTAYMEQIVSFKNNNGLDINLIAADPEEGLDELVSQIADGSLDYTILDENIAFIFKQIYPNLHISTPVSLSQNIAWAVKKDNTGLLDLLNAWEEKNRGSTKWNMIYNKYFKNKSGEMRSMQSNFDKIKTGELSSYDQLIQKYATQINWDWRLLTSLIRRESRFNKEAHSRFGAYGLMQVLPGTASQFGIQEHQLGIPEYNIMAGTRFIQWLEHYWSDKLPDTLDHKPFILASYNAGPGHVLDAMRLAEKNDLDPHIWYGNVETMLLYKSKPAYYKDPVVRHGYCRGKEPVFYVKDIYKYFEYYKVFTDEQSPKIPATATASL